MVVCADIETAQLGGNSYSKSINPQRKGEILCEVSVAYLVMMTSEFRTEYCKKEESIIMQLKYKLVHRLHIKKMMLIVMWLAY